MGRVEAPASHSLSTQGSSRFQPRGPGTALPTAEMLGPRRGAHASQPAPGSARHGAAPCSPVSGRGRLGPGEWRTCPHAGSGGQPVPSSCPPTPCRQGQGGLSRNPRPERITFELGVWRPPPRAAGTGDEVTHGDGGLYLLPSDSVPSPSPPFVLPQRRPAADFWGPNQRDSCSQFRSGKP